MSFKVLTFNIHHGKGIDKELDLERISQIIKISNADIIGLNEVDRFFSKRSNFMDQAQFLANELKLEYVYGPAVTYETTEGTPKRQFGNAVLSKMPIIESKNHPFDFLPQMTEDRALLEVNLSTKRKELKVYVTHLSLAPFQHRKQSAFILGKLNETPAPALVMGDWNMTPASRTWKIVTQSLGDVWSEVNPPNQGGYTFPSKRPFRRLDYIFFNKHLRVVDCEVMNVEREASDHLPFTATLDFINK